ncbi:MAG: hypothetical protein K0S86_2964 [Geminicoccaceae bacterium]|nr:hypothetical protein [Geminicoccaceae bacterium]
MRATHNGVRWWSGTPGGDGAGGEFPPVVAVSNPTPDPSARRMSSRAQAPGRPGLGFLIAHRTWGRTPLSGADPLETVPDYLRETLSEPR